MKNLLQTLVNLFIWFNLSVYSLFGIIWYGKLPKVSMYHRIKRSGLYKTSDMYLNSHSQVQNIEDVPTHIKHKIIDNYINSLYDNETFENNVAGLDIPIFDGKEIIGSTGISDILNKVKLEQL